MTEATRAPVRIDGGPEIDADVLLQRIDTAIGRTPKSSRTKDTAADREVRDRVYSIAAEELRQFIERYEQLETEKKAIADQQKEVMAEAKGRGYDTRAMKRIIALRKRKPDDIAEEEAILDMYRAALGMP